MKVARDKIFERLLKREKGKQTHRVCDILKHHKTATDAATKTSAHPINDTKWKVSSQRNKDIFYVVLRNLTNCTCQVCCPSCKVYIYMYMYSCTCLNATINTTLCKHDHYVHMTYPPASNSMTLEHTSTVSSPSLGCSSRENNGQPTIM